MKSFYKFVLSGVVVNACVLSTCMAQVKVMSDPYEGELPLAPLRVVDATKASDSAVIVKRPVEVAPAAVASPAAGNTEEFVPSSPLSKVTPDSTVAQPSERRPVVFEVLASDRTIRDVLVRWSSSAGWKHSPEHWAVDRDLPIAGSAGADYFGADFVDAVRKLLDSTDLTDRPVQPCFYSNKVVRVVAKAELCDKTNQ